MKAVLLCLLGLSLLFLKTALGASHEEEEAARLSTDGEHHPPSDYEDYPSSPADDGKIDEDASNGGGDRDAGRKSKDDNEVTDYQIYELIDTMTSLTSHRTFYELLAVTPESTPDQVARQFRSISMQWHPDKNPAEEARLMYTLLTSASAILRNEVTRKRYDWILNEAPPWHRSSYLVRRFVATSRLSVLQVLVVAFGFAVLAQLVVQWSAYLTALYTRWASRRAVDEMGRKERKRFTKRMAEGDPAFLAWSNTSYQNLLESRREAPRMPRLSDLFILRVPLSLFAMLYKAVRKPKAE